MFEFLFFSRGSHVKSQEIYGFESYVDFILALPGDTYEKFSHSISDLISSGQHNRIKFNNLSILPNAEMAQKDYMEKYQFKSVDCPIVNLHGSLDETPVDGIYETQKLVISSKDMPTKDWIKTRIFASMTEFLFFNKILNFSPYKICDPTSES